MRSFSVLSICFVSVLSAAGGTSGAFSSLDSALFSSGGGWEIGRFSVGSSFNRVMLFFQPFLILPSLIFVFPPNRQA